MEYRTDVAYFFPPLRAAGFLAADFFPDAFLPDLEALFPSKAAWAAARRAMGTLKGEQET